MGWQDAPIVPRGTSADGGGAAWQQAPEVGKKLGPKDVPDMPAPATRAEPSLMEGFKALPQTALSAASAIPARAAGNVAAIGHGLFGGGYGTPEGAGRAQAFGGRIAERMTYQPTNPTSQDQLATLAKAMEASKLEGMGPTGAATAVRGAPGAARAGREVGRMTSAVGREMAPELGLGGIPKPPKALAAPDPTRALAAKAQEHGIPLRPDMLSGNKFLKMAGEASEQVPLSGGKGGDRQNAFNKALALQIGAEGAEKLTPDVYAKAMNKYGEMIGDISAKNPVPFAPLKSKFDEHVFNAAQFETGDVAKVVSSYVKELTDAGAAKGAIDGTAFRKIRTKLTGQMRRTINGDLKHALSELDDDLLDAIQGQLSPQELQQFNQARKFYSNGKTLEPLVAKGTGDISPAALMARVTGDASGKSSMARGTRGEIGDLARIGQKFLKEPNSSGTAERALTYGAMGGGAAIEPHTAAGIYGAANIYNRLGPWLARRMIGNQGQIPQPPK